MGLKGEHQVKVSTRAGIGTYIMEVLSIQRITKTKFCQQVLERKIITSLELIEVVNST
jgi:hypothetical protein